MIPVKPIVGAAIIAFTIGISFGLPRPKYEAAAPFEFSLPTMSGWLQGDVSNQLNLKDQRYNFVSQVFARQIVSDLGERFLFLVLDAANFHHPGVCFNAAGYKTKPLPEIDMKLKNHRFKAQAVYTERAGEGTLILYWIAIDQKVVNWTEQKLKQLWYSFFNKKRIGLMVRLDIPTRENTMDSALSLARHFLTDVESALPPEKADYLFGSAQA